MAKQKAAARKTAATARSKQRPRTAAKNAVDNDAEAVAEAAAQADGGRDASTRACQDFIGLQQENFAAVIRAGNAMARGYEAIGREVIGFTRSALDANFAAAQAMLGAATVGEALALQRDHLRRSLDQAVAGSAKLGEVSAKAADEALAPLQGRANATVERFVKRGAS